MVERELAGLEDEMAILGSRRSAGPGPIRSMIDETERIVPQGRISERPGAELVMRRREYRFMR